MHLCLVGSHGDIHEEDQSSTFDPLAGQENRPGAGLQEGNQEETQNHLDLGSGMEDAGLAGDNQNAQGEDAGLTEEAQDPKPLDANGIEETQDVESEHAKLARWLQEGSSGNNAHGSSSSSSSEEELTPEPTCGCEGISASVVSSFATRPKFSPPDYNNGASIAILSHLPTDDQGLLRLDDLCSREVQRLGSYLGLKTNMARAPLRSHIQEYWLARRNLEAFKREHHVRFCLDARPSVPNDELGVRRFPTLPIQALSPLTVAVRQMVVADLVGPHAWLEWENTGNLCVEGMFSWLWDGITVDGEREEGIGAEMDLESKAFLHHQQERNGESNRGWSWVMYFSLTQQIIRQDLGYWALCASLRSDGNPRMVSYPYYTKHVVDGDSTFFRHLDINVPRYLEFGWGADAIQGSVSLDEESPGSCTEIVPGFHRHIRQWWAGVVREKRETGGDVHSFTSSIWNKDDERKYGSFVPVPCSRGGVRVTRPEIPHGSCKTVFPVGAPAQPGTTIRRRTILPWFMGIKEDGLTLDNPKAGTWSDLVTAHIQQLQPKLTPSGKSTANWPVLGRFPGTQVLRPQDPVAQALVCQLAWTEPAVEDQANRLLGPDRGAAQHLIAQSRLRALRMVKNAFPLFVQKEQLHFKAASYFNQEQFQ